jgi:hypothetical protein
VPIITFVTHSIMTNVLRFSQNLLIDDALSLLIKLLGWLWQELVLS